MTVGTTPIELFTPEMLRNPFPTYERLRREAPAYRDPRSGITVLSRYEDVYGALRDHETFSSDNRRWNGEGTAASGGATDALLILIGSDPSRHTRLKALINRAFTPRRVAELEPYITGLVDELLAEAGTGDLDLIEALAVPLPMTVIAQLMGIPQDRRHDFKRWSNAAISARGAMTDEARDATMTEMTDFFMQAASHRQQTPLDDLIGGLVAAEVDGEHLRDWQVMSFCVLLLIAGNETTTNLIGNMLNVLVDRPDLWARLREDRGLIEPAIEEALRFDSPIHMLSRYTTRDIEVGGTAIPEGASVGVLFASANRDPDGFADPDEFRLDRELSRHVAFGMGIHYCLGAPLARAEARIALNALLDRHPSIARAGGAERQTASAIMGGFQRLPLRLPASTN